MKPFIWNILLALIWASVGGEISPGGLLVGFVLGYAVLWFTWGMMEAESPYFLKILKALALFAFFVKEMFVAGLRVAWAVVNPAYKMSPGIVAVPLREDLTDGEITLLASIVSLTPGTLSLEVSRDRRHLYIHAMFVDEVEDLRRNIKEGFERRIHEVMR